MENKPARRWTMYAGFLLLSLASLGVAVKHYLASLNEPGSEGWWARPGFAPTAFTAWNLSALLIVLSVAGGIALAIKLRREAHTTLTHLLQRVGVLALVLAAAILALTHVIMLKGQESPTKPERPPVADSD